MTDSLWIGDSYDVEHELKNLEHIKCVLNVADDMCIERDVPYVVYAQCGLTDGPGNALAMYHAAVLMLYALLQRGPTLVVDPEGTTRPVVVAIMYQHLTRRMGWDHWLGVIREKVKEGFERTVIRCNGVREVIQVTNDCVLDDAHRSAFNRINWRLLSTVMEG